MPQGSTSGLQEPMTEFDLGIQGAEKDADDPASILLSLSEGGVSQYAQGNVEDDDDDDIDEEQVDLDLQL